jgi:hypothetical protein
VRCWYPSCRHCVPSVSALGVSVCMACPSPSHRQLSCCSLLMLTTTAGTSPVTCTCSRHLAAPHQQEEVPRMAAPTQGPALSCSSSQRCSGGGAGRPSTGKKPNCTEAQLQALLLVHILTFLFRHPSNANPDGGVCAPVWCMTACSQ